jgi:uncharacterized protein YjiS (DUF1127 family)
MWVDVWRWDSVREGEVKKGTTKDTGAQGNGEVVDGCAVDAQKIEYIAGALLRVADYVCRKKEKRWRERRRGRFALGVWSRELSVSRCQGPCSRGSRVRMITLDQTPVQP